MDISALETCYKSSSRIIELKRFNFQDSLVSQWPERLPDPWPMLKARYETIIYILQAPVYSIMLRSLAYTGDARLGVEIYEYAIFMARKAKHGAVEEWRSGQPFIGHLTKGEYVGVYTNIVNEYFGGKHFNAAINMEDGCIKKCVAG